MLYYVVLLSYSTSMPKPSWPRRKPTSSAALWPQAPWSLQLTGGNWWKVWDTSQWHIGEIPVSSSGMSELLFFSVHEMCIESVHRICGEFLYEISQGSPRLPERADPFRALVWASWLKPGSLTQQPYGGGCWFLKKNQIRSTICSTLWKKTSIYFIHISSYFIWYFKWYLKNVTWYFSNDISYISNDIYIYMFPRNSPMFTV